MTRSALIAERLFDGTGFSEARAVLIENGRVAALGRPADIPDGVETGQVSGILAPALVDLQVNGGGGILLNDAPGAAAEVAAAHRACGTGFILPTYITGPRPLLREALDACPGGLHLEGPWLNPGKPGVHRPDFMRPPAEEEIEAILAHAAAGAPVLVTLAPEIAGLEVIGRLAAGGVKVFAGHSLADAETIRAAADAGLCGVTHLFNAMTGIAGREPGTAGAALADDRLVCGLIADGHHVHADSLRLAWKAKGAGGIALVSDAMPPAGGGGAFSLYGVEIRVEGGRCVAPDGRLAGAALPLADGIRVMVEQAGVKLADALAMAGSTPARVLGLEREIGHIRPGARADFITVSQDLRVSPQSQKPFGGVPKGD
jgi:N-acetylglucosamine-6-phosphate deacetylase